MDIRLERRLLELRAAERGPGLRTKHAPLECVLAYPSPYSVAMSSLGYLQVLRLLNARQGTVAERAMLPTPDDVERHRATHTPLLTVESLRPAGDVHVFAISLAYELELAGLVSLLDLAGLAPFSRDRSARDPLVVVGGPLTYANPLPAGPFADIVVLGEGEDTIDLLFSKLEQTPESARGDAAMRRRLLEDLAGLPGFFVPSIHGARLPAIAATDDARLPAVSALFTPNTELADMQLIEPERGCSRGCTFCVMRRSTNGGMRFVDPAPIFDAIADDATKIGLVGAAVTDHPKIRDILRELIDGRGLRVGISSLRADRLDDDFVALLVRGGYRSMTVAIDGSSARLAKAIEKGLGWGDIENAATLAAQHRMHHIKIYGMVGLPGETDGDLDEFADRVRSLARVLPVVLGVSPFVPKYRTPLARASFCGEARAREILDGLRGRLPREIELRVPSAREAYTEYRIARGGFELADAIVAVARSGGRLSAWRTHLRRVPELDAHHIVDALVPLSSAERRAARS